jgi:hypothetical protein
MEIRKIRRTIVIEYLLTDEKSLVPGHIPANQYDELKDASNENVIKDERGCLPSSLFANTEYDLIDDEIEIVDSGNERMAIVAHMASKVV